ncbi:MAG TPA: DUF2231 domain-containing protein [Gemmatimonadaceae bacterium]|nr:DUF2231 domain-containing protein [Gemmatimonadaceae bacterium]
MRARATLLGHAVHPMLVHFPLGLLGMAVFFDVISLATRTPQLIVASYYMIAAGIISGLVAAVFGVIDWFGIPSGTRAKAIATWHARGNVIVLILFAVSWWVRRGNPGAPPNLAIVLALAGGALSLVTGWLGGELVSRLAVSVDEGAHVNASSSLTKRAPSESGSIR